MLEWASPRQPPRKISTPVEKLVESLGLLDNKSFIIMIL